MKTSFIIAVIAAFGTSSILAAPLADDFVEDVVPETEIVKRSNLPGLNAVQTRNARAIIAEVKKEKLGLHGCEAGIATGLTESSLLILANRVVPKSLSYKHDGFGSDHDSIGIFQQRAEFYPNIACDMGAACSASQFFKIMKSFKNWENIPVATLCQDVQRSGVPFAYEKWVVPATKICKAGGV